MADLVVHQKPKVFWRRIGEILSGSALGFLASSFLGPNAISWWYEPPSKDAFSCAGSVRDALQKFVVMQLVSALVGGVIIAIVLFVARRWWASRTPAPPVTPPPA